MRNLGRQDVFGYFTNGQPLGMKLQVTEDITQTLLSVSKLEASGNDVISVTKEVTSATATLSHAFPEKMGHTNWISGWKILTPFKASLGK